METRCKRGHSRNEENTYIRPNGQHECRVCHRDAHRQSYHKNPKKHQIRRRETRLLNSTEENLSRRNRRLRKYGITPEKYDLLFQQQGGKCAICGSTSIGRHLSVDHDHKDGRVRGLLCIKCNTGLGMLNDDYDIVVAASEYIRGT